jgi:hypothetical protein
VIKPNKKTDEESHPAHVQDFHLACKIKYIELFSRHNVYSIVLKNGYRQHLLYQRIYILFLPSELS